MCDCKGRDHIVCGKWKISTAKTVLVPPSTLAYRGYTVGKAIAEGLVINPDGSHIHKFVWHGKGYKLRHNPTTEYVCYMCSAGPESTATVAA